MTREKPFADDLDLAAYAFAEAARYARLPVATLRAWALGRHDPTSEGGGCFTPLIRPASRQPPLLSFSNLIEAHVLRSLRTEHGVSVKALRSAFDRAVRPFLNRLAATYFENCILASLRHALLPRLIFGELRVKDAEPLAEAACV
jgi:hypothetical protein